MPNEGNLRIISKKQLDNEIKKLQKDRDKIIAELNEVQDILKMIQETGVVKIEDPRFKGIPEK